MRALLPITHRSGTRIITNMGAANPVAAGRTVARIARELGLELRIAVVTGDDVLDRLELDAPAMETQRPVRGHGPIVSANAYLGADAIVPAIETGADVIVTGRVADPSLFVAPIAHRFGWALDDWHHLGGATCIGHLLECAGQICGGYFADPGKKNVPDMARLGFPYADVTSDGVATIGKVDGTGGCITLATVKEQLLYEVTDPFGYITPDVLADFSEVTLQQSASDRVMVSGARGHSRPAALKVSVGYLAGFVGEGEIAYAGSNASARAALAGRIIEERLAGRFDELRVDLVGVSSLHGRAFDASTRAYEVRLRVAARTSSSAEAALIGEEVEALYTNGPAGGGGARRRVYEHVGIVSVLLDRREIETQVVVIDSRSHAEAL
jgi:hypothetical protein